jgi:hypothetical protein
MNRTLRVFRTVIEFLNEVLRTPFHRVRKATLIIGWRSNSKVHKTLANTQYSLFYNKISKSRLFARGFMVGGAE